MIRLLKFPADSKALRRPGEPVDLDYIKTVEFQENLESMKEILKQDGLGLAATQANWPIQMFILCQDENFNDIEPKVFINPKITSSSKATEKKEEGCLSFEGLYLKLSRPKSIVWEYQDINGKTHEVESSGYYARAIMHECDHLNGKLFFDYLSPVGRLKFNRWLKHQ